MLVSHHAALSALTAVAATRFGHSRSDLLLFFAAAVGQDVDHYLWHAIYYRNPSLIDAYRFFRSRYGRPRTSREARNMRLFHGLAPLAGAAVAALVDRRLASIALGMAFHGALDGFYEHVVVPRKAAISTRGLVSRSPVRFEVAPERELA